MGSPGTKKEPDPELDLAEAIRQISKSFEKLSASGLNRKGIIALIHDHTKLGKRTISDVLDSLTELEKKYCKPKGKADARKR